MPLVIHRKGLGGGAFSLSAAGRLQNCSSAFQRPFGLRLNYSRVSAERKADSSNRHGSQNEWAPASRHLPPKTNCETTSRPLLNHAVNLSRLSTPSRAERQTKWSLSSAACLERAGFQVGAAALRFRAFRQRSRRSATGLGRLNKNPPTSRENIRFFDFDLRRTQAVENAELPLFSRGLRRSPEMRVTQILQH